MPSLFITGTNTGIGKTFISTLLLRAFNNAGYQTFGIKPISCGCSYNKEQQLVNDDALLLQKTASLYRPYEVVNPLIFEEPIAPNIAAAQEKIPLTKSIVKDSILSSIQVEADINLIEGAGGWAVPLNDHELFSDAIADLKLPVILVVGMKLGCLNDAILTYRDITARTNVPFIGWIANCLEPNMLVPQENIHTLQTWIKQPCLGVVPYQCNTLDVLDTTYIAQYLLQ